jgi:hypothetical protein
VEPEQVQVGVTKQATLTPKPAENTNGDTGTIANCWCWCLLLVLTWRGGCSPVHDHPCDGCWLRGIEGSVQEVRYSRFSEDAESLVVESEHTVNAGDVAYIDGKLLSKGVTGRANAVALNGCVSQKPFAGVCGLLCWQTPWDCTRWATRRTLCP